jgi:glycerol uptake facilitator-like aquaporin
LAFQISAVRAQFYVATVVQFGVACQGPCGMAIVLLLYEQTETEPSNKILQCFVTSERREDFLEQIFNEMVITTRWPAEIFWLMKYITICFMLGDRLCGLVVRVLGYRSGGPGSIPGNTRKKNVVGLERGPLSLVSTTEELLDRKVAAPV